MQIAYTRHVHRRLWCLQLRGASRWDHGRPADRVGFLRLGDTVLVHLLTGTGLHAALFDALCLPRTTRPGVCFVVHRREFEDDDQRACSIYHNPAWRWWVRATTCHHVLPAAVWCMQPNSLPVPPTETTCDTLLQAVCCRHTKRVCVMLVTGCRPQRRESPGGNVASRNVRGYRSDVLLIPPCGCQRETRRICKFGFIDSSRRRNNQIVPLCSQLGFNQLGSVALVNDLLRSACVHSEV